MSKELQNFIEKEHERQAGLSEFITEIAKRRLDSFIENFNKEEKNLQDSIEILLSKAFLSGFCDGIKTQEKLKKFEEANT